MRRGFLLLCALTSAALAGPSYAGLVAGCSRAALDTSIRLDAAPDVAPEPEADAALSRPIETSHAIDLLLVVDNSQNTDVAHRALADTVPYLIDRLANPACVNGLGNVLGRPDPKTEQCAVGVLDFPKVTDLHIGVISTSLGSHGADTCSPAFGSLFDPSQMDAAHLLSRRAGGGEVPTYQDQGFLAWDPSQAETPPGDADPSVLSGKLSDIVLGAGEKGCGFESQLESFYRFLVDPEPYATIEAENGEAVPRGSDMVLLQQRADFLRPDSALMILLLTDEDDCSTREGGAFFLSNQSLSPTGGGVYRMPRGRSECAKDPSDPCCAPCGQPTPSGCPSTNADPACKLPPMSALEDPVNLRCFDQKRRFGADFLYPVDRYVAGLSEKLIADREGNMVQNPLFAGNRSPKLVIFGGIVGVPWQDIAKDPKSLATGYAPPSEIDWRLLLADPDKKTPPLDPLMVASIDPRSGESPRIKVKVAPPDATSATANPVNGHERSIPARDDLQYVCIYPRQAPKACAGSVCECEGNNVSGNPICQQESGAYAPVQRFARALPGTRELALIQALGDRAAVASVCAPNVTAADQDTFAYKPAVDALLRAVRRRLE